MSSNTLTTVFLIGCAKTKAETPSECRHFYKSALFRSSLSYVERQNSEWYVLSAKYGLVQPDQTLEPYDLRLHGLSPTSRRQWACDIAGELSKLILKPSRIVVLAGAVYTCDLRLYLEGLGHVVEEPLLGMGIGKRLSWLKGTNHE